MIIHPFESPADALTRCYNEAAARRHAAERAAAEAARPRHWYETLSETGPEFQAMRDAASAAAAANVARMYARPDRGAWGDWSAHRASEIRRHTQAAANRRFAAAGDETPRRLSRLLAADRAAAYVTAWAACPED